MTDIERREEQRALPPPRRQQRGRASSSACSSRSRARAPGARLGPLRPADFRG
jgi:hypothetical protein